MKKTLTTCLLLWLVYTPNPLTAFEVPPILERNIADDIIQKGEILFNHLHDKSFLKVFADSNFQSLSTYGIQGAIPVYANKRTLCRFELNLGGTFYPDPTNFFVFKAGFSGRRILNPRFILGSYFFYQPISHEDTPSSMNKIFNPGMEFIWLQRGTMLTLDGMCSNLSESEERFYQGAAKFSFVKPPHMDTFTGITLTKHPYSAKEWAITLLGLKGRAPFKKWNLNQWWEIGEQVTYHPKNRWPTLSDFKASLYLQLNLVKKPTNPVREYLKMPIDRFFVTPYYPQLLSDQ